MTFCCVVVAVPPGRYWMNSNEMLTSGQSLVSANGKAHLILDNECNLRVTFHNETRQYLERSSVQVTPPCYLKINRKGTLLLVSSNFKVSVIAHANDVSATYYQLALTDQGYLKMYAVNKAWELSVKPKPQRVFIDEDQYLQAPDLDHFDAKVEKI
jgi:hypothetical protein